MIFQGLSVARNCPAPVTILDIKRGLLFHEWTLEICIKNDSYFIKIRNRKKRNSIFNDP